MGLVEWLSLIRLALQFPESFRKLIKTFQDTPVEKQAKLAEATANEAEKLRTEGRPTWEN